MGRVDTLQPGRQGDDRQARRTEESAEESSPFFWWIRALLAAGGAIALFPVVFAVVVKVIDLGV